LESNPPKPDAHSNVKGAARGTHQAKKNQRVGDEEGLAPSEKRYWITLIIWFPSFSETVRRKKRTQTCTRPKTDNIAPVIIWYKLDSITPSHSLSFLAFRMFFLCSGWWWFGPTKSQTGPSTTSSPQGPKGNSNIEFLDLILCGIDIQSIWISSGKKSGKKCKFSISSLFMPHGIGPNCKSIFFDISLFSLVATALTKKRENLNSLTPTP